MTKAHRAGYAISLMAHLVIAAAFLSVPLDRLTRQKSVVLDFSIVKGQADGKGGSEAQAVAGKDRINSLEKKTAGAARPLKGDDNPVAAPSRDITAQSGRQGILHADTAGPVSIAGEGAASSPAGPSILQNNAGEGTGGRSGSKVLNYTGAGGADERSFSFIRDRIMQNIIYPERARRMGWEGKVTLSFVVHENGSIGDIKIVNSSGFPVLDENARDAVAKTNFKRKVPVRLVVLLPVEYRLK